MTLSSYMTTMSGEWLTIYANKTTEWARGMNHICNKKTMSGEWLTIYADIFFLCNNNSENIVRKGSSKLCKKWCICSIGVHARSLTVFSKPFKACIEYFCFHGGMKKTWSHGMKARSGFIQKCD